MKKVLTLCIVTSDNQILLGMKKRGFGAGRYNGFGGKIDRQETIFDAALRELKEEAGITAETLESAGILNFSFEDREDELEVHVFRVPTFVGEPKETEEMKPKWFPFDEIPYGEMWVDDEIWLPSVLEGRTVKGVFHFDTPATVDYPSKILQYTIEELK